MEKPTIAALRDAVSISQSYASMILSDSDDPEKFRTPPRALAILIFRKLGWKHPSIADLTDEQMQVIEQIEQWTPRKAQAA